MDRARGRGRLTHVLPLMVVLLVSVLGAGRRAHATGGGSAEYDFIVVGGGSAGGVVAARLAERRGWRVLLLEAGGEQPTASKIPAMFPSLPRTRVDWNMTSEDGHSAECGASTRLNLTSGRVLGGGSSLNYMLYVRGAPADYDAWAAAAGDPSWGWTGLYPYFKKSEKLRSQAIQSSLYRQFHGRGGRVGVTREERNATDAYLRAFGELYEVLFDVNGPRVLGYTKQLYTIADGLRQSTAATYLAGAGSNLHVRTDTLVTEVLFDDRNAVVGVAARGARGEALTFGCRREVIVSAGSLNTPKLLMLSGVGPAAHLRALGVRVRSDLPVGHNLHDHVISLLSIKMENSSAPPPPRDPEKFPNPVITGYVALGNRSRPRPDYQNIVQIVPHDAEGPRRLCSFNLGYGREFCDNMYEGGRGRNTLLSAVVLLHPRSRGRVALRSADPRDPPTVCSGTFDDEADLEALTGAVVDSIRVLNTTRFRSVRAEVVDPKLPECGGLEAGSRRYWRCYVRTTRSTIFHWAGTCALGPVVDARLRVRGVRGVRVVDASVMPESVSGNINAAVLALAEKAADLIKRDHPP